MKNKKGIVYALLIFFCAAANLPVLSMIGTALKPRYETLSTVSLFTLHPTLDNFIHVLTRTSFAQSLVNTIFVALIVTVLCVAFSTMAGFGLSRCRGILFDGYTMFLIILQMLPAMLIMIPLYVTLSRFHLVDTHFSLILIYTAINLPFGIWTLKGFFDDIPTELDEAAMIDGCSRMQVFFRIILPSLKATTASVIIWTSVGIWNDYQFQQYFLQKPQFRTITLAITTFFTDSKTDMGAAAAAAFIVVLPPVLMYIALQKYFVQGAMDSAVK